MKSVDLESLDNRDSVVAWSKKHAVFVDQTEAGHYEEDNWGEPLTYDGEFNGKVVDAFAFGPVRDSVPVPSHLRNGQPIPPPPRIP